MKLTLRKANALQNSIQDQLKNIEVKTSISINEFQNPETELLRARSSLYQNDGRRVKLMQTLYRIRAQVGQANAQSGISDLLSNAAYLDKRLAHLKSLTESTATDAMVVIEGKLEKLRNSQSERRVYGYNDTVDTGVLLEEQLAGFRQEAADLKKKKQEINDLVLELNVRTEVELDAETVELLKSEQLL